MKTYTQEEFNALPVDEYGVKICPTGDYSQIRKFSNSYSFGKWCIFGNSCRFGMWCRFGEGCSFGMWCRFGKWCRFGEGCRFGNSCRFGEGCRFGERFSFGELTNARYIAVDRIGSALRKTYFFAAEEGWFVRAGCWFGTFEEFAKRVKEVHGGTKHERDYLAALDLAKVMLDYPKEGEQ